MDTLLSLEESRLRARPLRSWSAAARASIADRLRSALGAWQEAWKLEPAERTGSDEIACAPPASRGDVSRWVGIAGAAGAWWSFAGPVRGREGLALATAELSLALFDEQVEESREGSMAHQVVHVAWNDLLARWGAALAGNAPAASSAASVASALAPWSGGLVARLAWWDGVLEVLLAPELVERLAPAAAPARERSRAAPLQPLWQAIAGRGVQLRVELDAFDVGFGELAAMQAGQVIGTSHALDRPVQVALCATGQLGTVVCTGFLGRSGDARAVELAGAKQEANRSGG